MGVSSRIGRGKPLAESTTSLAFGLTLLLVFTLPWRGAIQIGQIGTIGRVIGAIVGAVWCLSVFFRANVRVPAWFHVVLGMLVCWSAISALWTIDVGQTVETTLRYVFIWAILFAIWDLYRTPEDIEYALQAYVLGGFVVIGAVLYNFALDAVVHMTRFTAFGLNPNIIARMLVLGAPLAWYLSFRPRATLLTDPLVRSINVLYIALAGIAIVLTGARQGMIGFAITLVFIGGSVVSGVFQDFPSVGRKAVTAGFGVLAAGIVTAVYLLVVATDIAARLLLIPAEVASGSFGGRGRIWDASIEVMAQRPFIGHGSGTFVPAITPLFPSGDVPVAAHNAFFQLGVELGFVGIGIYTVLLLGTAVTICTQSTRYRTLWLTVFAVLFVLIAIEGIVANVVKYLLFMFAVSTATMPPERAGHSTQDDIATVRDWYRLLNNRYIR